MADSIDGQNRYSSCTIAVNSMARILRHEGYGQSAGADGAPGEKKVFMMRGPDDHTPADTGETRSENIGGMSFERTAWPIGPPVVNERNIFLVITAHPNGALTVSVVGDTQLS